MTTFRTPWIFLIYVLLALFTYHLAWHVHELAAFTNNAFDLVELVNLHPNSLLESPQLLTGFLLRLPLLGLAGITVISTYNLESEKMRWLWRGIAILIVLRLNPPMIFYPYGGGSLNDQQLGKMMYAGLLMIIALILLGKWLERFSIPLNLGILIMIIVVAIIGYSRTTSLVQNTLTIDITIGGGFILFIFFSIMSGLLVLFQWRYIKSNQH